MALDLDIVVLLLGRALLQAATATNATFLRRRSTFRLGGGVVDGMDATTSIGNILALLLLFLLTLLTPDLIDVEELNSDEIALKSTVTVFATADEDVGVEVSRGDVSIAAVLLVDAESTRDKLTIGEQGGKGCLRQVRSEERLALLLLLLVTTHARANLWGVVLAAGDGSQVRLDTGLLVGLDLSHLQSVELLACENVGLLEENLALRKLHELRLRLVLEVADRADRLSLHRTALAVTRLERLGARMLVHVEVAHVLSLLVVAGRSLRLRLAPVAVKVAGALSAMAAATTKDVTLRASTTISGGLRRWELEAGAATSTAAHAAHTAAAYSHALAATMTTASTHATSRGAGRGLESVSLVGRAFSAVRGRRRRCAGGSAWNGKLEATSLPLRLSRLGCLLGLRKGERVSPSVTAACRSASSASARGVVLASVLASRKAEIASIAESGRTAGGCGRRAHAHVGHC